MKRKSRKRTNRSKELSEAVGALKNLPSGASVSDQATALWRVLSCTAEPDAALHELFKLIAADTKATPKLRAGAEAALSELALAEDWSRSEEDAAWSHLQPAK